MRVRCIRNQIRELNCTSVKQWIKNYVNHDDDLNLNISKGQEYVVYGIHFWDNHPFYLLCDDPNAEYPTPFFAGFFEIIDDRFSSHWALNYRHDINGKPSTEILHKEWIASPTFYENLVDGAPKEIGVFKRFKKEMDEEADF